MRQLLSILLLLAMLPALKAQTAKPTGAPGSKAGQELPDAVRDNDLAKVKALVEQGADINGVDGGATPAGWAISYDASPELLDYLLQHGATVPITDASQKWSQPSAMLLAAAMLGRTGQSAVLIARGADVNVRNAAGATALLFAATEGHLDTVRLLVDKGADSEAATSNGLTPLTAALIKRQFPVAAWLAKRRGAQLHRSESAVSLSAPALQPLVGNLSSGSLRMNVEGLAVPVSLKKTEEKTSGMRQQGLNGLLLAGGLLALGSFEFDTGGSLCLAKGGFLVLPATPASGTAEVLAQSIDPEFPNLLADARAGKTASRLRLIDHYAAGGDLERAEKIGNQGSPRLTWLGPLPPQDSGVTISVNGGHIAHIRKRANWQCLVMDNVTGPEFDKILPETITLSSDGKHVGYGAVRNNKTFMVIDGRRGPVFEWVRKPVFSADVFRVAYPAGVNDKAVAVIDGQAGSAYDGGLGNIALSQDGKRVGYSAKDGGRMLFVVDGKPGTLHDGIGGPDMSSFSPDGKRVAYVGIDAGKMTVIVDGIRGQESSGFMVPPRFSPDAKHITYAALKDGKRYMVVDDQWSSQYQDYRKLIYSPDGKRFAFEASQDDKMLVVVDGQAQPMHQQVSDLIFSPDSKHFAYLAVDEAEQQVIIDGTPVKKHIKLISTSLRFAPDSKNVAYTVADGEGYIVMVDGKEGPSLQGMAPGGPTFLADGSLEYLGVIDGILYRIRHVRSVTPAVSPSRVPNKAPAKVPPKVPARTPR